MTRVLAKHLAVMDTTARLPFPWTTTSRARLRAEGPENILRVVMGEKNWHRRHRVNQTPDLFPPMLRFETLKYTKYVCVFQTRLDEKSLAVHNH